VWHRNAWLLADRKGDGSRVETWAYRIEPAPAYAHVGKADASDPADVRYEYIGTLPEPPKFPSEVTRWTRYSVRKWESGPPRDVTPSDPRAVASSLADEACVGSSDQLAAGYYAVFECSAEHDGAGWSHAACLNVQEVPDSEDRLLWWALKVGGFVRPSEDERYMTIRYDRIDEPIEDIDEFDRTLPWRACVYEGTLSVVAGP
jgi:hypothetical protein